SEKSFTIHRDSMPRRKTIALPLTELVRHHAQQLRHAPRLADAADRVVRVVGVEDLADRAQAALVELVAERLEQRLEARARLGRAPVHVRERGRVRADQPAPRRALVVAGVALGPVALVAGHVGLL